MLQAGFRHSEFVLSLYVWMTKWIQMRIPIALKELEYLV
jgi:hypothetical protein